MPMPMDEPAELNNAPEEPRAESSFPIVGIGASAGGIEAFTQFLIQLPAQTGMAFVLVQHLDPRHESWLTGTPGPRLPVVEASQGLPVAPDHVYPARHHHGDRPRRAGAPGNARQHPRHRGLQSCGRRPDTLPFLVPAVPA